jgi:cytochrome P450
VKLPADLEADAASIRIQRAITGFIAQTRARLEAEPQLRSKPSNLLEALVSARDEPDSGFSDREVIGNAITMVFAGEDTTSNTIAWLLNLLPQSPAAMDAAAAEADRLLGQDRVAGALAPAGTILFLLLRIAAEREGGLDQPQRFLPERWLGEGAAGSPADPSRKLFPFGGGPRFCPGRFLAMAEIKMVMSMLLRNFTFTLAPAVPPGGGMLHLHDDPERLAAAVARARQ